jgi:hypothetical protein
MKRAVLLPRAGDQLPAVVGGSPAAATPPPAPLTQDLYAERQRLLAFIDHETIHAVAAGEPRPSCDLEGLARQAGWTHQDLLAHWENARVVLKARPIAGTLADLARNQETAAAATAKRTSRAPEIDAEIERLHAERKALDEEVRVTEAALASQLAAREKLRGLAPSWAKERHAHSSRRVAEEFRPLRALEKRLEVIAHALAFREEDLRNKLEGRAVAIGHLETELMDRDLPAETLAAARAALVEETYAHYNPPHSGTGLGRGWLGGREKDPGSRNPPVEQQPIGQGIRQWVHPEAWKRYCAALRAEAAALGPKVEDLRRARQAAEEEVALILDHYLAES